MSKMDEKVEGLKSLFDCARCKRCNKGHDLNTVVIPGPDGEPELVFYCDDCIVGAIASLEV